MSAIIIDDAVVCLPDRRAWIACELYPVTRGRPKHALCVARDASGAYPKTGVTRADAKAVVEALKEKSSDACLGIMLGDIGGGMSIGSIGLETDGKPIDWAKGLRSLIPSHTETRQTGTEILFLYPTKDLSDLKKMAGMGMSGDKLRRFADKSGFWPRLDGHHVAVTGDQIKDLVMVVPGVFDQVVKLVRAVWGEHIPRQDEDPEEESQDATDLPESTVADHTIPDTEDQESDETSADPTDPEGAGDDPEDAGTSADPTNSAGATCHDHGAAQNGRAMFEITVFTNSNGPLTKTMEIDEDGKLQKTSAAQMRAGEAQRHQVADLHDLAAVIDDLSDRQAINLATFRQDLPDKVRVVTAKNGDLQAANTIARTKDYMGYREGEPAIALLDFDDKAMPAHVQATIAAAGGVWAAMVKAVPALADCQQAKRASTSAGIYNAATRVQFKGSNGQHIFILVKDGSDIPRFLNAMLDRAWLAGFGWGMASASGSFLVRGIVDAAVGSPERLVFEGKPTLKPPLAQYPRRVDVDGEGMLDTRTACPDLTAEEKARLRQLKAEEKARIKPELEAAEQQHDKVQTEKSMAADPNLTREAALRMAVAARKRQVLLPPFVLPFDDPALGETTVGDVLTDPDKFIDQPMADPVEGVEYGRGKARVYRRPDSQQLMIIDPASVHLNRLAAC